MSPRLAASFCSPIVDSLPEIVAQHVAKMMPSAGSLRLFRGGCVSADVVIDGQEVSKHTATLSPETATGRQEPACPQWR